MRTFKGLLRSRNGSGELPRTPICFSSSRSPGCLGTAGEPLPQRVPRLPARFGEKIELRQAVVDLGHTPVRLEGGLTQGDSLFQVAVPHSQSLVGENPCRNLPALGDEARRVFGERLAGAIEAIGPQGLAAEADQLFLGMLLEVRHGPP